MSFGNLGYTGHAGGGGTGSSSATKPLIGVVGDGGLTDPVAGLTPFQNDSLIGLGATNAGRIQIVVDNNIQSNFGDVSSFTFNNITGTISDIFWVAGSSLYIDLNQ